VKNPDNAADLYLTPNRLPEGLGLWHVLPLGKTADFLGLPPAAYLVFRKETSASRPFPESEGAGAHKCWRIREGRGYLDQGGAIRR